jgi:hypothetical protein
VRLPVIVVLDNVRSLYNTGAFFRTADGCAVEKLVLCGITPRPDQGSRQRRSIEKTALGAETSVPWEYVPHTAAAVAVAAASGYHVAAVENSPQGIDLYEWTPAWPAVPRLRPRDRRRGARSGQRHRDARPDSDARHEAVAQRRHAAGVVLYELLRRWRAQIHHTLQLGRAIADLPVGMADGLTELGCLGQPPAGGRGARPGSCSSV